MKLIGLIGMWIAWSTLFAIAYGVLIVGTAIYFIMDAFKKKKK